MKIYAVWGQDQIYGGLHGMREIDVIKADDENEALDYARSLSENVISSYSNIYEQLEADIESECEFEEIEYGENTEEESNIREEFYEDDLEYGCTELDVEILPTLDFSKLEEMFYEDEEDFIERYKLN